MRIVDPALDTKIQKTQGEQKIIVVGIKWDGLEYTYYSTIEFDFLEGEQCYAYINSITGLEDFTRTDKFGTLQTTNIVFADALGHFKEKVDTLAIQDKSIEVSVYFYVDAVSQYFIGDSIGTSPDAWDRIVDELLELNKGVISDFIWDESTRTFEITVTNNFNIDDVTFVPLREFVDDADPDAFYMQKYMNETSWPHVFGAVKNMPMTKLVDVPKAEIAVDKTGTGDGATSFTINGYENFPQATTLILEIYGRYETTFSILARGSFTGDIFNVTDFNLPRYTDVDITRLDFNRFQIDGSPTDIPWFEYSFLKIETPSFDFRTVCVQQDGDICTIRHSGSYDLNKVIASQRMWGDAYPGAAFNWKVKAGTAVRLYSTNTTQEAWIRSRIYVFNTDNIAGVVDGLKLFREAGNVTIPY
jgi:hypothetical protein